MALKADDYEADTRGIGGRAWSVFDEIAKRGRGISPSEFEDFGFNSQQAMRPHVKALEDAQLVDNSIDDTDQRGVRLRSVLGGWIVRYKRANYTLGTSNAASVTPDPQRVD